MPYKLREALSTFSANLVPDADFEERGKAACQRIFTILQSHRRDVAEPIISGSMGKRTGVSYSGIEEPDFDVVIFLNIPNLEEVSHPEEGPPFRRFLREFLTVFQLYPTISILNSIAPNFLRIKMNGVTLDISPAIFFKNSGRPPGKTPVAHQRLETLELISGLENPKKYAFYYTPGLTESSMDYFTTESARLNCHSLIRLAKFWNRNLELPSDVRYVTGRSFLIERVALYAAQELDNEYTLVSGLEQFLQLMSAFSTITIHNLRFPIYKVSPYARPIVLDAVNPFSNLALLNHDPEMRRKIINFFEQGAVHCLQRLRLVKSRENQGWRFENVDEIKSILDQSPFKINMVQPTPVVNAVQPSFQPSCSSSKSKVQNTMAYKLREALSTFSVNLVPDADFEERGKAACHRVFEILCLHRDDVAEVKISGSMGKRTAISFPGMEEPDFDVVIFLNIPNLAELTQSKDPPFGSILHEFLLLFQLDPSITILNSTSQTFIGIQMDGIKMEISPAVFFKNSQSSLGHNREETQRFKTLNLIRDLVLSQKFGFIYSPGLAEASVNFVKSEAARLNCHALIRLAKFWNRSLELPSGVRYVYDRPCLIERMALHAAEELNDDDDDLISGLEKFLQLMSVFRNLVIHKPLPCELAYRMEAKGPAVRPIVLDPVNQFNNLARLHHQPKMRGEIIKCFERGADHSLTKLKTMKLREQQGRRIQNLEEIKKILDQSPLNLKEDAPTPAVPIPCTCSFCSIPKSPTKLQQPQKEKEEGKNEEIPASALRFPQTVTSSSRSKYPQQEVQNQESFFLVEALRNWPSDRHRNRHREFKQPQEMKEGKNEENPTFSRQFQSTVISKSPTQVKQPEETNDEEKPTSSFSSSVKPDSRRENSTTSLTFLNKVVLTFWFFWLLAWFFAKETSETKID